MLYSDIHGHPPVFGGVEIILCATPFYVRSHKFLVVFLAGQAAGAEVIFVHAVTAVSSVKIFPAV